MTKSSEPRQRPFVPLRAVLPILRPFDERSFPGYAILDEYPGVPGLVLWESFRDAELWARAPSRADLFSDGAEARRGLIRELPDALFEAVRPQLLVLSRLAFTDVTSPEEVAAGCDAIAGWSEQQSRLATAAEFAQVASFANPRHAMYAVRAARVLRMRAEWARAWSWFDHAIFLARRTEDRVAFAQAYLGVGVLYFDRGNLPMARKAFRCALRVSVRHRLEEERAAVYHNLFAVEGTAGFWERAESYALKALQTYPAGSCIRSRLARDLAYRWILRGHFERALPLSQEVLHHFTSPADRALVWSDIARAAAGAGEVEVFEDAWLEAMVLLRQKNVEPFATNILLNLAHGALSRSDPARALAPAKRALELGRERQEHQYVFETEALLDSLRSTRPQISEARPGSASASEVAATFIRVLQQERALS
jgi:tetratricopeptide (TPR) repeat protein